MVVNKVETREDEEQDQKFNETIELLLAAGYFRARIKGLSPFDKVVGGMTWCISTCDFDIDVDLLFQENSTIGQKISLTEKIVAVLPKMKCPYRIEPHQIQGLDFIHIFPVIQWLVKRAIETREELGDQIREFSLSQFHKNYALPEEIAFKSKKHSCIKTIESIQDSYKPKRLFKKPAKFRAADEETQVHSTLLEYGKLFNKISGQVSPVNEGTTLKGSDGLVVEAEGDEKVAEKIKQLMEGMSETDIKQMLSSRTVGSIVGLQSDQISEIVQEYTQRHKTLQLQANEMKSSMTHGKQAHKRQVVVAEKVIAMEREKLKESCSQLELLQNKLLNAKDDLIKKQNYNKRLQVETKKLETVESHEDSSELKKLQTLVALNESLKKQEQDFKVQCKVEMKELEERIAILEEECTAESNPEVQRFEIISSQLDSDNEKLRKMRMVLAKRNREIASLQWKIDDVPSRAELAQYQSRFIELYNQMAFTHKETKQFYTLFNTLDDTKLYLEKEIGLLNSIHDGFEKAASQSTVSKEEFLEQLEKIMAGVKTNKEKVVQRCAQEKEKKDKANALYLQLVEKQRLYFKTVCEFQEECKRNEILLSKLVAAGIPL